MKKRVILTGLTLSAVAVPMLFADDLEEAAVSLYAINHSGISIQRALTLVQETHGGLVHEYELEDDDDQLFHEFDAVDFQADRKFKIRVAVADGAVALFDEEDLRCGVLRCKDDDGRAARALEESGYTLRRAVDELTPSAQHLLQEAEVELERGVRYLKLEFIGPDGEVDILVDIDTGNVIPTLTHD